MVKVTLSIGDKGGSYEVPVRLGCEGILAGYKEMKREEKASSLPGYENARRLYNTEQVLFNVCNTLAVATAALVVLRHFSLSLTTVLMTASFWVARELVFQDVSELEKGPFRFVIEGHKIVDPDWKASIELAGVVFFRRVLPPVSKDKIDEISMTFNRAVEELKQVGGELIREGSGRLEQAVQQGVALVKDQLNSHLKKDE